MRLMILFSCLMRLIPSTISKKANVACFQSHRLKSWESCSKVTSNAIRPNYWNTRYMMSVSGSSTASVDTIELRRTVEDALDLMKLNIKTIPSRDIIVVGELNHQNYHSQINHFRYHLFSSKNKQYPLFSIFLPAEQNQ